MHPLDQHRVRDPKFLLLYSPLQFAVGEVAKPDGSLSLTYVAGALRRAGYEVEILDCTVGGKDDLLETTFFRNEPLPNGLLRVGMAPEAILAKAAQFDVIGISSIFTPQTSMVLEVIRLIKTHMPDKLVMAGGTNARSLRARFFDSGADVIALSEADVTVLHIADALRGKIAMTAVPGIAFRDESGKEKANPVGKVVTNLDELAMPAWDLLPLNKYWDISRPHGGHFATGARVQYASLQTSRGCPFRCEYCHISEERGSPLTGDIAKLRFKSIDRVLAELQTLKDLGVEYVYFEDDSLFAKKKRAYDMFNLVKEMGLQLLDVNGINICHLYKNNGHNLEVDMEFLEMLRAAGFQFLTLPFESASQRILDKYATSKWNVDRTNTKQLIKAFTASGIAVSGNYMIGYPDETKNEIDETILLAKQHVQDGLDYALFFAVVPFPGTALFTTVIRNGQLDPNFNTDEMRWTKSIMKNLAMDSESLEHVRQMAWLLVNRSEYVAYKRTHAMPNH